VGRCESGSARDPCVCPHSARPAARRARCSAGAQSVPAMVLECRDDSLNNNGGGTAGPHLSVSLCCIWEQPAPAALAAPPPPPQVTVRRPPGRSKRCLADRASWAGFSTRGRSHVLMGTQVLPHHLK